MIHASIRWQSVGVVASLLATAAAQDFVGFSYNSPPSAISRGSLGTAAGEVMTRIDGDEVAGWGTQVAGHRTISALYFVVQDQYAPAVANTFTIKLYPESASSPGQPDLAAGVTFATGVTGPVGTGSIAAIAKIVTPAAPVSVPIQGGGDVFIAFVLPAVTTTSYLSMQVVLGYAPSTTFAVYDTPNLMQGTSPPPTGSAATSHFCSRLGSASTVTYNLRRHHVLDVAHTTAGGRSLGITNQSSYAASNTPSPAGYGPAPGTGNFLSGSFPDTAGTNAGRADDLAFDYYRSGLGSGSLVVFLADFGAASWAEVAMSSYVAGTGAICLDQAAVLVVGVAQTSSNEAWQVLSIPAAARSWIGGLGVRQQAIGIDAAGLAHASPCSRQVL